MRVRGNLVAALLIIVLSVSPPVRASSAVLLMLEQVGCEWCEAWTEDIGESYPNTWEGRAAPLRRIDIHDPLPSDLAGLRVERFTPTFILMVDGREIGRIRGYPGPDFFWPMLDELLTKAGFKEHKS